LLKNPSTDASSISIFGIISIDSTPRGIEGSYFKRYNSYNVDLEERRADVYLEKNIFSSNNRIPT
jgi:hypothetical protein